jgi:hypothetical protein
MAGEHDVSHGDLLLAIGQMQGKLDALVATMSQQRIDVAEAFRRLNEAEKRIAQGVIIAATLSLIMPILVTMLAPRIAFIPHATIEQRR